jgi:alkanesulfonate monooxygenase SsuD/methylene tetrahydromethanopterin reductase-like flavin-dependent oxidoreductase (luciferase family)
MIHVGLNLNNREALIAPDYGVPELLDLGAEAEGLGFDSVWVGDSLFSKPRYEPLALLAALSQRTARIQLGTACLVTTLREPLQLALAWATIDVLSGGRTIMGACAGNIAEEAVKREFEAVGLDWRQRMAIFEERLAATSALLADGSVTFHGEHVHLDRVGFSTGAEPHPLLPVRRPPVWVVANPSIGRDAEVRSRRAAARVARLGDGWLTCCRAGHPGEVTAFAAEVSRSRAELGRTGQFTIAYQVTLVVGDTRAEALAAQRSYVDAYYPGFADSVSLADWGPAGSADEVAAWFATFAEVGVDTFICRFASLDQVGQSARFARDVLPAVRSMQAAS